MIKKFLKKKGWLYIPGILFLALNSRIQTLAPKALGDAIDLLEQGALKEQIYRQAGLIVLIAVLVFVTRFVWRMFIILNARFMEIFLREELFVKLQKLPVSFFIRWHSGDLMAYAINDVGAVRMTFGPVIAQRIIEEREQNGLFHYPEDLMCVPGIGEKTLSRIAPYLYFEPENLEHP